MRFFFAWFAVGARLGMTAPGFLLWSAALAILPGIPLLTGTYFAVRQIQLYGDVGAATFIGLVTLVCTVSTFIVCHRLGAVWLDSLQGQIRFRDLPRVFWQELRCMARPDRHSCSFGFPARPPAPALESV